VIGTLAVDGWAVTFGTGLGGAAARPVPSSLYQMYQSLYCYMMVRCSAVLMWRLKS